MLIMYYYYLFYDLNVFLEFTRNDIRRALWKKYVEWNRVKRRTSSERKLRQLVNVSLRLTCKSSTIEKKSKSSIRYTYVLDVSRNVQVSTLCFHLLLSTMWLFTIKAVLALIQARDGFYVLVNVGFNLFI